MSFNPLRLTSLLQKAAPWHNVLEETLKKKKKKQATETLPSANAAAHQIAFLTYRQAD